MTAANKYLADAGNDAATAPALRAADMIVELSDVLGINLSQVGESDLPHELVSLAAEHAGYQGDDPAAAAKALLAARQAARAKKEWATADAIRDGIAALGLVVEDTAAGARLTKKA